MNKIIALFATLLFISASAHAGMEVITPDGKRALLKDDGTWIYVDALSDGEQKARFAYLTVENERAHGRNCTYGLRLQNDLTTEIKDIVLFFAAHNHEGVMYETATRGFQRIKPTNSQYKEIMFRDISCDDIQYIRVHGGDRCEIGDLNKFSAEKGTCLEQVYVESSDLINIFKRYHEEEPKEENEEGSAGEEGNYEDQFIDDGLDGSLGSENSDLM